mmetsp:Transcript_8119/g.25492  ORF Transcript_8119/g.25492 Transcript_8119/m.25492 type:complete len:282 (-) Transcript_8119:757-1602(-)
MLRAILLRDDHMTKRRAVLRQVQEAHDLAPAGRLHLLHRARDHRQVLDPVRQHHHVVLQAHTSDLGAVLVEDFKVDVPPHRFVPLRSLQQRIIEVKAWLHCDDHARLQCARGAKGTVAMIARAGGQHSRRKAVIAAHVVRVDPDEMAQPVRHEHSSNVVFHQPLHRRLALQDATLLQASQDDLVRLPVHVHPHHACLHHPLARDVGIENNVVDGCLLLRELAIGWEGHRDVARVAVQLGSHIVHDHVAILDALIVRHASVTRMQDGRAAADRADGRVSPQA